MALIVGPLNYLTSWLLRMSSLRSEQPNSAERPSVLLDIQFGPTSPVIMIPQFYAAISSQPYHVGPLTLLRGLYDGDTLPEYVLEFLHTVGMAAASGLTLRFRVALSQAPWYWVGMADQRRPHHEIDDIRQRLARSNECCNDTTTIKSRPKCCHLRPQHGKSRLPTCLVWPTGGPSRQARVLYQSRFSILKNLYFSILFIPGLRATWQMVSRTWGSLAGSFAEKW